MVFLLGTPYFRLPQPLHAASCISPGLGRLFRKQSIFEPGQPQRGNACGILIGQIEFNVNGLVHNS
jgi:hypothetical protein